MGVQAANAKGLSSFRAPPVLMVGFCGRKGPLAPTFKVNFGGNNRHMKGDRCEGYRHYPSRRCAVSGQGIGVIMDLADTKPARISTNGKCERFAIV